ncbi:Rqc2 family fibronectin-binding protein [Salirhabdus salicampi]|uniref:Rqc2 family fibronectin-binding protein n=1 Tax=Salirhabdus salicampi TaxID=476102 RepID=UPI0020C41841|nr:NFACT RNA binding domain-containing protein [Salirhabdus salicampi]MCP8616580.1 NFACT family protein [Salirhabdus salicampi]
MSFDGVVTRAVTDELNTKLLNGRVGKIYQPTKTELVFTVRSKGENHQLLLSAHPSYARFHITDKTLTNPKVPPMFCMLLRKYLAGGMVEKIEQVEMERVVRFHIKGKDEIGDETSHILVVELMGKHSNIMLVNEEKNVILDSIKHIPPAQNRFRTIMPGQPYVAPPSQDKLNPLQIDGEQFIKKLDFNSGKLDQQIVRMLMGFSPVIAKDITTRAHLGSNEQYLTTFLNVQAKLINHEYEPTIYTDGNTEKFYVLPLSYLEGKKRVFESVSAMLDTFYSGKAERDRVKQQVSDLIKLVKNERDKNIRKLKKHEKTLQKAEKADSYKHKGELLTAHMHLVKKGDESVTVVDYYDPDGQQLTIELNPNKTPSENAQLYFQTYQKLKKSKSIVQQEMERANNEIIYLEQVLQQLDTARESDLEEIREELQEEGYVKKKRDKPNRKKRNTPEPDEYVSSDGTLILVGRNNKQNDYVTNRMARKSDVWLHTKDIPGSHVVIRDNNPSEETLKEAAMIAAFYSKAKLSSSVPVDYTEVRHVRKPSGSKPGYVIYDHQTTIFVTPDEEKVQQLKK